MQHSLFSRETVAQIRPLATRFALFCDETVRELWGEKWLRFLQEQGLPVTLFSFPPGEANKTREHKAELEDALFHAGYNRDCCFIALGGGVTMDLVGFLAATFCRGVPLVFVPTTLLGMIDACVGGKNAVNCPFGKNLIGTRYEPTAVVFDLDLLETLDERAWREGMSEAIKYALIQSPELFTLLKGASLGDLKRPPLLEALIRQCVGIKRRVVAKDPDERLGFRRILNFGHTVAHAIEAVSAYEVTHGEALYLGLRAESQMSAELGHLARGTLEEICAVVQRFSLPAERSLPKHRVMEMLVRDKKAEKGVPRFVLLEEIGRVVPNDGAYCAPVPEAIIERCLS